MRTDFRLSKAFQSTVFFQRKSQRKRREHQLKQSIAGRALKRIQRSRDEEKPFEEILRVPGRFPVCVKKLSAFFSKESSALVNNYFGAKLRHNFFRKYSLWELQEDVPSIKIIAEISKIFCININFKYVNSKETPLTKGRFKKHESAYKTIHVWTAQNKQLKAKEFFSISEVDSNLQTGFEIFPKEWNPFRIAAWYISLHNIVNLNSYNLNFERIPEQCLDCQNSRY